jgi:hypothetical protein
MFDPNSQKLCLQDDFQIGNVNLTVKSFLTFLAIFCNFGTIGIPFLGALITNQGKNLDYSEVINAIDIIRRCMSLSTVFQSL